MYPIVMFEFTQCLVVAFVLPHILHYTSQAELKTVIFRTGYIFKVNCLSFSFAGLLKMSKARIMIKNLDEKVCEKIV